jgi:hypothetical protein
MEQLYMRSNEDRERGSREERLSDEEDILFRRRR